MLRAGTGRRDALVFQDEDAGIAAGLAAHMRVVMVGDLESAMSVGLSRVRDFSGIRASVDHEGVTLDFD